MKLFFKSVFRRPVLAGLMALLFAAAAFGVGTKLTEYAAVSSQAEGLMDYYRPIGTLSSAGGDVAAGAEIVSGSEYVDFTDYRRYVPGVLDGVYNADIDGQTSDYEGSPYPSGVNVSEILVWATLLDREYNAEGGYYDYFFRVTEAVYGYPDRAGESMTLQMYRVDDGDGAFAQEDAALEVGGVYLVRANYYNNPYLTGIESNYILRRAEPGGRWFLTEDEGRELLSSLLGEEEKIQELNRHSMLVCGTADMSRMPDTQESTRRYYLTEGRWPDAEDNTNANPVCAVHSDFASLRGIEVGDTLTLTLRDLPDSYVGYITEEYKDSYGDYATETLTLTVVGIFGELSPNIVLTSYSSNYMYIPDSLIPESFAQHDNTVSSGSFSFMLSSPEVKDAFLAGTRQELLDAGIQLQFIERDWESFSAASDALRESALSGLALYGVLFAVVCAVCSLVYVRQRAKEMAIARALGAKSGALLLQSLVPYILLSGVGISAGCIASRLYMGEDIVRRLEELTGQTAGLPGMGVMAAAALVLLLPALLFAFLGLGRGLRKSVLSQLQGGHRPRAAAQEAESAVPASTGRMDAESGAVSPQEAPPEGGGSGLAAMARFTARQAIRSPGRTALFLLTALGFAFALAFLATGMDDNTARMDELYETVQVRGEIVKTRASDVVSGHPGFISQQTVDALEDTGFFTDSYLEAAAILDGIMVTDLSTGNVLAERRDVHVCAPTDGEEFFERETGLTVEYFGGYDSGLFANDYSEETELGTPAKVLPVILPRGMMEALGVGPGDIVVVTGGSAAATMTVAGAYEGSITGLWSGSEILMPVSALAWVERGIYYSRAEYEVDRAKNRELGTLRTYTDEIFSDGEAGLLSLTWILWDEELREAIEPLDSSLELMRLLYPIIQALSALTAAMLAALLLIQRARTAALLRVFGLKRAWTRLMLGSELLIPALMGQAAALMATAAVFPSLGAGNMLYGAAVYFAGCIVGALAGAVAVTARRPLELLQVKE